MTNHIVSAAINFADVCGDALLDNADRFTCQEANVIYDLLEQVGHIETAQSFLASHAEDDEPGDEHYSGGDQ